jgi:hypothetical protein
MLEVLVALDLSQRYMKSQFETDVRKGAKIGRANRGHRVPLRAASTVAVRSLARLLPRGGGRQRPACPEGGRC